MMYIGKQGGAEMKAVYNLFGPIYKEVEKGGIKANHFYSALWGKAPLSLHKAVKVEEATGGKIKAEWLVSEKTRQALNRLMELRGCKPAPPNPLLEIRNMIEESLKEGGNNNEGG